MASALDLSGTTVLVTGSTQGMGPAIAVGLTSAGTGVGVNGRSNRSVSRAMEAILP